MPTLLIAGLVVLVSPAVVYAVLRAQGNARDAALRARLAAAQTTINARRWERPVLRGASRDQNAAAWDASWLRAVPQRVTEQMTAALRDNVAPSDEIRAEIQAHRAQVDAMREATQGRYAAETIAPVPSGAGSTSLATIRAARFMFNAALTQPPGECLRLAADATRAAQDHAVSDGLVGLASLTVTYQNASKVARRCAVSASRDELDAAAAEFDSLATHQPPPLDMLDVEVVRAADGMADLLRDVPRLPRTRDDLLRAWMRPRALPIYLDMLDDLSSGWTRPRAGTLAESLAMADRIERRDQTLPELVRGTPVFQRYFTRLDTARAELRDTATWLRTTALTRPPATAPTPE